MERSAARWMPGLLALLCVILLGCPSGGGTKPPIDPIVPPPSGGGQGGGSSLLLAPSGVTATAGDRSIRVRFNGVAGVRGYNVYLSEDGSTFFRFNANSPYTGNNILLTGLINGQLYFVGVSAVYNNGESNTAYAGGSPTAQPVIPSAEPPPPVPKARNLIDTVSVWNRFNSPVATANAPNDRRLLLSWIHETDPALFRFRVRYFLAGINNSGDLIMPTGDLIYVAEFFQLPGGRAILQSDPDFPDYLDPAMEVIAQSQPVPGARQRTEAALEMFRGSNLVIKAAAASGLGAAEFISLLIGPNYGYSEQQLGLSITGGGGLTADQDVLDGVDRVGWGIEIKAIFDDGSESSAAYAFGRTTNDIPERVPAITLVPVPNPSWTRESDILESPVLPQVNWNRLRYPMGSDIADYGVVRVGPVEVGGAAIAVVFRLSETGAGQQAIFDDPGTNNLRELLRFTDGGAPRILRGRPYTYSVFALDRAGRPGPFSPSASIFPGGAINQPPTLQIQIRQGVLEIFPGGNSQITTGPSEPQVTLDFTGSTDPEGDTLTYFYQIGAGAPVQSANPVITLTGAQATCVASNTNITLTVGVQDEPGNLVTQQINLTLVPGPGCP